MFDCMTYVLHTVNLSCKFVYVYSVRIFRKFRPIFARFHSLFQPIFKKLRLFLKTPTRFNQYRSNFLSYKFNYYSTVIFHNFITFLHFQFQIPRSQSPHPTFKKRKLFRKFLYSLSRLKNVQ